MYGTLGFCEAVWLKIVRLPLHEAILHRIRSIAKCQTSIAMPDVQMHCQTAADLNSRPFGKFYDHRATAMHSYQL